MMHWIFATALLLQSADTTQKPVPVPAPPVALAVPAMQSPRQAVPHIGDDKVQHFFVSYAVYTFAYAGDRAIGMKRKPALLGAFGAVVVIGAGKELFDRKVGKPFSGYDLVADIIGGFAAYAVMKQVR